ncbi:class I SAM-dependent methyltransferase [Roseomonas harenae]|uniref:class I SAM-dependent methyltransferase n=1 Tax=Muricoccus harenae TaxID=2692566 RepID=UPI00133152F8|nr:class I SAM-dependent methyltransferase [Roseomonas harenae]
MTAWSRGYVADSPYTASYHPAQVPAHLALAAAMNGVAWRPRERMTVADIGCGRGYVIAALAGANPGWTCLGIDYNPAHVSELSDFADAAGLDNLGVMEADLAALSDAEIDSLPPLDVAMLHGVWTWVSDAVREGIVRLLQRRLKPGGIVYIAYNALPGFGADAALQRVIRLGASMQVKGDSTERAQAALPLVRALHEASAVNLPKTPMLQHILREGEGINAAYLAHEMMTAHWRPVFFADMVEALAPARLDYVGSATLAENLPDMLLEPAQRAIWDDMPEGVARETIKDLFLQRPFRRDVFIRGARRIDRQEALDPIILAQVAHRPEGLPFLPTPRGKAELPKAATDPIMAALAQGPQRLGTLRALPERTLTPEEVLVMLDGTSTAMPIWRPAPDEATLRKARRFNAGAAAFHAAGGVGEERIAMASPLMGAGVPCTPLELTLASQPDIAEAPDAAVLLDRIRPGLEGEEREQAAGIIAHTIRERMPFWRRLGVA